jgi:hypothetical protein
MDIATKRSRRVMLCAATLTWLAASGQAQVLSTNLIYTAIEPCRLIDTRVHDSPLVAGEPLVLNVVGSSNLAFQGGSATGCPIPGFDTSQSAAQVQAVMVNVIAVGAAGPGDLVAWPSDHSQPTASILNYAASASLSGLNLANGVILPVRQDAQGTDITVLAQVHGTHLVIDALGFFSAASTGPANSLTNLFIGHRAGKPSSSNGLNDTGFGFKALSSLTTGLGNTAVGSGALQTATSGGGNTAVGSLAGLGLTTGGSNTVVGSGALVVASTGIENTALGADTLSLLGTGTKNTAIGFNAGATYSTESNNIAIGNQGVAGDSGVLRLGDSAILSTFLAGVSGKTSSGGIAVLVNSNGLLGTTTSSLRFKEDVTDMGPASEGLLQLRPVTFHYKPAYDDGGHLLQYGLIAEEVAAVYPALVRYDEKGNPDTVRYQFLNSMLLNELQKQHSTIATQTELLTGQAQQISTLTARLAGQSQELAGMAARLERLEHELSRKDALPAPR